MADENESNLVQRREDRRTLEKMRRKLATSGTVASKADMSRHAGPKRSLRIWPFAVAASIFLIALNFGLRTHQGKIIQAMGATAASNQLKPPAGLSLDEQVRFWAYAIYDIPKLKARFPIPKGTVIDNKAARLKLEGLLAENLGNEVRNEVFVLQQKDPPPAAAVKTKNTPKIGAKKGR
jgi:hypothetical protein